MKCDDAALLMSMLLDDMIGEDEKNELLSHLDQCENCRRRFESFQMITLEARSLPEEAPPELHEKIMEGIRGQKRKKVIPWRRAAVAAAACAAMILLVIAGTRADLWTENTVGDEALGGMAARSQKAVAGVETEGETESENADVSPMMLMPAGGKEDAPVAVGQEEGAGLTKFEMALDDGSRVANAPPALNIDRSYGDYLVVVGTGEIPEYFSGNPVNRYPEDGQITIEIHQSAKEEAAAQLTAAGFVVMDDVPNLPPTDAEASDCLVIIIE